MTRLFRCLPALTLLIGGAARAHALLLSFAVEGQDGVLHFNGRVDVARSRVTLMDGDASHPRKFTSEGGTDAATMRAHFGDLPPGSYILRWEVLSVDGHISRGDQTLVLPPP